MCKDLFFKFEFVKLIINCRKMPPKVLAGQPGKVVEITYHEVDFKLRLDYRQGTSSSVSPILISSEGNVRETIEYHK